MSRNRAPVPRHEPEFSIAKLTEFGPVLKMVRRIPVESEGQGIALGPNGHTIGSIQRRTREVLAFEQPK